MFKFLLGTVFELGSWVLLLILGHGILVLACPATEPYSSTFTSAPAVAAVGIGITEPIARVVGVVGRLFQSKPSKMSHRELLLLLPVTYVGTGAMVSVLGVVVLKHTQYAASHALLDTARAAGVGAVAGAAAICVVIQTWFFFGYMERHYSLRVVPESAV
ncbi:hypothetical protein DFH06DRAFT_520996 [Mycena polygramma]|nr:hypothetical protein DFH06DRAFT_520996 [Mycena polygramma]